MTTAFAPVATETVIRVLHDDLMPCPLNPRTRFDEATLAALAASVREKGVIHPLLARLSAVSIRGGERARYEIVDGERRWRAAQLAGVAELPVILRELSDSDVLEAVRDRHTASPAAAPASAPKEAAKTAAAKKPTAKKSSTPAKAAKKGKAKR